MLDAPTTRSNRTDASVGAAGTNDRNRGWSTEMHAGASTSANTLSASWPPRPAAVIVCPAAARSSAGDRGLSSGGTSIDTRSTAYSTISSVSRSIGSSWTCTDGRSGVELEQLAALVAVFAVLVEEPAEADSDDRRAHAGDDREHQQGDEDDHGAGHGPDPTHQRA